MSEQLQHQECVLILLPPDLGLRVLMLNFAHGYNCGGGLAVATISANLAH